MTRVLVFKATDAFGVIEVNAPAESIVAAIDHCADCIEIGIAPADNTWLCSRDEGSIGGAKYPTACGAGCGVGPGTS